VVVVLVLDVQVPSVDAVGAGHVVAGQLSRLNAPHQVAILVLIANLHSRCRDPVNALSVFIESVPCVGVANVRVSFEDLLVDDALDGDLDVDFDEAGGNVLGVLGRQLQLQHRQVAFGAGRMIDQVKAVVQFQALLKRLRLNQDGASVRGLALESVFPGGENQMFHFFRVVLRALLSLRDGDVGGDENGGRTAHHLCSRAAAPSANPRATRSSRPGSAQLDGVQNHHFIPRNKHTQSERWIWVSSELKHDWAAPVDHEVEPPVVSGHGETLAQEGR